MELHRFKINTNHRKIRIMPVGDLQLGDPGFRKDLWERWLAEAKADKDAYFIFMGDYSNAFRPTIRKAISKVMVEDAEAHSELDYLFEKEMQELADILKPIAPRIIGIHSGHHNHQLLNGTNTDQYLAQLLRCKWLGFEAWTRLSIERSKAAKYSVDIFSTHGCGGSSFTSTDMYNLERKIMPNKKAHIYLRGHSTKVYAAPAPPLEYIRDGRNETIRVGLMPRWLGNTGGFMEGRTEGHTSYVEEKNMPSCALGWLSFEIYFKTVDKTHLDNGYLWEISPSIFAPEQI